MLYVRMYVFSILFIYFALLFVILVIYVVPIAWCVEAAQKHSFRDILSTLTCI